MTEARRPATAQEIVQTLGPLDDDVVIEIIATGATAAEVLEAFTWVNADDQIGTETEHGPRGVVNLVCEILRREEPAPDER